MSVPIERKWFNPKRMDSKRRERINVRVVVGVLVPVREDNCWDADK